MAVNWHWSGMHVCTSHHFLFQQLFKSDNINMQHCHICVFGDTNLRDPIMCLQFYPYPDYLLCYTATLFHDACSYPGAPDIPYIHRYTSNVQLALLWYLLILPFIVCLIYYKLRLHLIYKTDDSIS